MNIRDMSEQQLVDCYVAIALAQDHALLMDEYSKYNRLYREKESVEAELRARPGDQRRLLVSLFGHDNAQVRLNAAIATLAIAPERARQTLQRISDQQEYPQAANARGMMMAIDEGEYVPT